MKKNYIKSSDLTKYKEIAKKMKKRLGRTYGTSFMSSIGYKCVLIKKDEYDVYQKSNNEYLGVMIKRDFAFEALKRGFNPIDLFRGHEDEGCDYPDVLRVISYRIDQKRKYQTEHSVNRNII